MQFRSLFLRTSAKIHHETAQENFSKNFGMIKGEFFEQVTEQYLDEESQPNF